MNNELKIVAIGASASGLQALEAFFSHCPDNTGLSFVILQHLAPDVKSIYPELLGRITNIPISVAENAMTIEPDHIYLMTGRKNVILKEDKLLLLNRPPAHALNFPVDIFFISLAKEKKKNAVGIVLSGSGSDGTKGAAAIKEEGGIVIVQNPEESGFGGMPLSVIHAGLADFILNASHIPNELISYFNYSEKTIQKEESRIIEKILEIIKQGTNFDFTAYRKQTLTRRIAKRKSINKFEQLADYEQFLERDEDEQRILVDEFLIGVTHFFRDKKHFEKLSSKAIPEIIAMKKKGETIKLWVIGCGTGEEAYSLAILLKEALIQNPKYLDFKIFATDINFQAIEKASKGFFTQNIALDILPEYLSKYFKRKDNGYIVQSHLRKHIVFSNHDILHNPPFNKMDLISCRNLLIYFQEPAQSKTIKSILYALNNNGYLFLGSSESLGSFSRYFEVIDHRGKLFRKKKEYVRIGNNQDLFATKVESLPTRKSPDPASELSILFAKNLALVNQSVCICINEHMQVMEVYGSLRLIGSLPPEGFTTNLLKLLPREFHVPIATAIRELSGLSKDFKVISKLVNFVSEGKTSTAKIIFDRFDQKSYPYEKYYLIVIKVEDAPAGFVPSPAIDPESASMAEIQQLQNLLEETRENLQLTIEELESSNEEVQSTNEELVSSNEELQSTNEELQSVNEELYTVNTELQEKNIQLLELNTDIENLINTLNIATLFLDDRMHIRRFTPSLSNIISLRDSDIGRSITNFSLPYKSFLHDVESVGNHNRIHRREIVTPNQKRYLQEIHYYVSPDERNKGTIINYTDITDLKRVSLAVEEKSKFIQEVLDVFPGCFYIYHLEEKNITFFNHSMVQLTGYTPEEIYDMGDEVINKLFHPDDKKSLQAHFKKMRKAKANEILKHRLRLITKNNETRWMETINRPFAMSNDGTVTSILVFLTNAAENSP